MHVSEILIAEEGLDLSILFLLILVVILFVVSCTTHYEIRLLLIILNGRKV